MVKQHLKRPEKVEEAKLETTSGAMNPNSSEGQVKPGNSEGHVANSCTMYAHSVTCSDPDSNAHGSWYEDTDCPGVWHRG
jgi:hypothetical protein